MVMDFKNLPAALSLGVIAGLTVPAWATTIEVLTLGDSITYGSQSDSDGTANPSNRDSNLGGYRFYLDRDIENIASLSYADFDFVGNRERGIGINLSGTDNDVPFPDNQHFGVSGATAASDSTSGGGTYRPSMLTGIDNVGESPLDSQNAAFDSSLNTPNAVLLAIGINSIRYDNVGDLASGATVQDRLENTIQRGVNNFITLLDGDDGSSRQDGNTGPRTGLVDRLTNNTNVLDADTGNDNAYFANDAHLFVALIIPQARDFQGGSSDPNSDEGFAMARQPSMVGDYNKRVKDELLSRMGPGGELEDRVTFVDMFSITLAELDLVALANEFFDAETEAQRLLDLRAAINPESEGGTDETDYVDWVINGFDEGLYDEGVLPVTESLVDSEGDNENFALMRDTLHPTNLGYAITAQVWANALESHYAVPEPSALSLLAIGGLVMAGRRRRRA